MLCIIIKIVRIESDSLEEDYCSTSWYAPGKLSNATVICKSLITYGDSFICNHTPVRER